MGHISPTVSQSASARQNQLLMHVPASQVSTVCGSPSSQSGSAMHGPTLWAVHCGEIFCDTTSPTDNTRTASVLPRRSRWETEGNADTTLRFCGNVAEIRNARGVMAVVRASL